MFPLKNNIGRVHCSLSQILMVKISCPILMNVTFVLNKKVWYVSVQWHLVQPLKRVDYSLKIIC